MGLIRRKCKNCGEFFTQKQSLQYLCSHKCDKEYSINKPNKNKENNIEKTLTELRNEAREVFQKWVKIRDKDKPCISCDTVNSLEWHGGHLFKAEIFTGLIFVEENCHKQCKACNFNDGSFEEYKIGLVKRYGKEYLNNLESQTNINRFYKFSKEELLEIKTTYQLKIKEL